MELRDEKNLSKALSIILNMAIIFGIILTGILVYDTFINRRIQNILIDKGIVSSRNK